MSLFIASLNSGSNGNCYYISNGETSILIDAGISCRETEKRMKRLGLSPKKIKAIFITHEHADHIYGVGLLSKKYKIPVYITQATQIHSNVKIEEELIRHFKANDTITIDTLSIISFTKLHDAIEPHSFVVSGSTVKVGVFTDIGSPCENLINHFSQCHAAFLESNYDAEMLENGSYPYALKNRIRGGQGHLSNKQALAVFLNHRPTFMTHLFLSHLSRSNNTPKKVKALFDSVAGDTEIIIVSREKESALYHIRALNNFGGRKIATRHKLQLELFQ